MACRCGDLPVARRDVRRMEDALDDIDDIIREFEIIAAEYGSMLTKERKAYRLNLPDFDSIDKAIGNENEEILSDLRGCRETISESIDNLNQRICRMEDEDERYHEEEEEED